MRKRAFSRLVAITPTVSATFPACVTSFSTSADEHTFCATQIGPHSCQACQPKWNCRAQRDQPVMACERQRRKSLTVQQQYLVFRTSKSTLHSFLRNPTINTSKPHCCSSLHTSLAPSPIPRPSLAPAPISHPPLLAPFSVLRPSLAPSPSLIFSHWLIISISHCLSLAPFSIPRWLLPLSRIGCFVHPPLIQPCPTPVPPNTRPLLLLRNSPTCCTRTAYLILAYRSCFFAIPQPAVLVPHTLFLHIGPRCTSFCQLPLF